jgi:hypothetical protein
MILKQNLHYASSRDLNTFTLVFGNSQGIPIMDNFFELVRTFNMTKSCAQTKVYHKQDRPMISLVWIKQFTILMTGNYINIISCVYSINYANY